MIISFGAVKLLLMNVANCSQLAKMFQPSKSMLKIHVFSGTTAIFVSPDKTICIKTNIYHCQCNEQRNSKQYLLSEHFHILL